jgi:Zn-dependent protease
MRPTLRLGRIAGIDVGVHWSLLLIGALLVTALAGDFFPEIARHSDSSYWAAAILTTVFFFGSVLAHELSHAIVAQRRGQRVDGITLWALGGVAMLKDEARDAKSELLVAAAGPAMSIALGGGFIGLGFALDAVTASGSLLPAIAFYLGVVNLVLAVFNLLPGAPLDGGRILSGALWAVRKDRRRAQIAAARAGRVVGYLLVGVPLLEFALGWGFNPWTAFIGLFVISASRAEETNARIAGALEARPIAQLMVPLTASVPEWTTVGELPSALAPGPLPSAVLLTGFGGAPSALLQTGALRNAHADQRVRELAIPVGDVTAVPPDMSAHDALAHGVPVVVLHEGRVIGVVGIDEVRRAAGRDVVNV